MDTVYQRKVSPVERLFIAFTKTDTPFSNVFVTEGTGVLDPVRWEEAVKAASEANPGSRLVLKGRLGWSRWVDSGNAPPVRVVDGSGWSGYDPEGASFLEEPLPFGTTNSCDILLVKGNPLRVVFRTLHACLDATGALIFIFDIFRALQNLPLAGSDSTLNDMEFLARLNYPVRRVERHNDCLTPTGGNQGDERGSTWRRVKLEGKYSKLNAQAVLLVAKECRRYGAGPVYINIPLDLRRRGDPSIRSTANLTRRITLHVTPEDTIDSIQQQMTSKLDNLAREPGYLNIVNFVPLKWLEFSIRSARKQKEYAGHYATSGTVSNVGKLPIELMRGGGYEAFGAFGMPPPLEGLPVFFGMIGIKDYSELVVGMPKVLASNGRIDKFISNFIAGLIPK